MGEAKAKAEEEAAVLAAYQKHASQVDDLMTNFLGMCDEAVPGQPEATVAGAMMALVRFHLTKTRLPDQPIVTRDLIVSLTPGLHKAAEEVASLQRTLDQVPLANPH